MDLHLAEIALASLEAGPVAYMWDSERKDIDAPGYYRPEHLVFAESNVKQWGGRVVPLYSAPPALTAEPVVITDDMAYAFHHALSDSSLGADEVEEIKTGLRAAFANVTAPVVPGDIDSRMKEAGMLSAAEILAGQPIDAFMKHAGVVDFESLLKWAEMRRAEFLRMQAGYELGDKKKDDLYEWVISHVAVFSELHVNIRAAMQGKAESSESLSSIQTAPALDYLSENAESLSSNSPVIPDVWVTAINALLDSDGSRGCFDAMDQRKARDEIERLLAAVPR
jgi:hypothetical protein